MTKAVSLSHHVLFSGALRPAEEAGDHVERCDVCSGPVPDDDGYAIRGRGMYLWTRGDQILREEVALCASCGTAIGVTALTQWDIEEEEG